MWDLAITLIGLWAIVSIVLPIIAIVKNSEQKQQIDKLNRQVQHLQQQVVHLTNLTNSSINRVPSAHIPPQQATPNQPSNNIPPERPTFVNPAPNLNVPLPTQNSSAQHTQRPVTTSKPPVFNQPTFNQPIFNQSAVNPSPSHQQSLHQPSFNQQPPSQQPFAPSSHTPDETSINVVTSLFHSIKQWFLGENLIVRVGALVLLVGVVLLLKLASQYIEVSIATRMMMVALAGLAVTGVGFKVSQNRRNYGLTLQGVGFAMIYLTIFASFRLYDLLPASFAMGLLVVLTGLSVMFSVWQNALPLAILAFGGAFFAPILISQNTGNVVMLFGYYLILNVAVAVIAHYRTWKLLNALSLAVTFGVAYTWGAKQYMDWLNLGVSIWLPMRWQLVILLVAHMALYLFIAVRYSQQVVTFNRMLSRQNTVNKPLQTPLLSIDAGLLFGTALLGFGLLASLLHDLSYHLAFASAILSVVYFAIGSWLLHQHQQGLENFNDAKERFNNSYHLLIEATLALGVGFLALVLPLALSAQWVTIGWAVQGASFVWLGIRTDRRWAIWTGLALQAFSILLMIAYDFVIQLWFAILDIFSIQHIDIADMTMLSTGLPLIVLTLSVAMSAFLLRFGIRFEPVPAKRLSLPATTADKGLTISLVIIMLMLYGQTLYDNLFNPFQSIIETNRNSELAWVGLWTLALIGLQLIHRHWRWWAINQVSRFVLPMILLSWLIVWTNIFSGKNNWVELFGIIFIVILVKFIGAWFLAGWHQQKLNTRFDQIAFILVIILMSSYLLPMLTISTETTYLLTIFPSVLTLLVLIIMSLANDTDDYSFFTDKFVWFSPVQVLKDISWLLFPITWLWLVMANIDFSGQFMGLYLPIINPLDLLLFAIILYEVYLIKMFSKDLHVLMYVMPAFAIFFTLSSILVRSLANYFNTPLWSAGVEVWYSPMLQTSLTILWSILATALMFIANRQAWRNVWFAGVTLLGIVVIKLVFVDMSKTNAIFQVISFIGAGGLMLLIGYLAPLPPLKTQQNTNTLK